MKKILHVALALLLLAGLTVSMAWSQEDVYMLNTEELVDQLVNDRQLVQFLTHALVVKAVKTVGI